MPSSTSNSDPKSWPETYWKRPIPTAHWQGVSLLTVVLVIGFMLCWETIWRLEGYEPSFEETNDLWSKNRALVGEGEEDIVIIGSSRVAFDIDLDMWEQDWDGIRPVMLGRVGTCPRPYLSDFANDETFRGILVCGITSGLFFMPDFMPPVGNARDNIAHFKNWSPSQKAGMLLSIPIESAFASINREDLSLGQLMRRKILPFANRMSPIIPPSLPPYFARIDEERRYHMWAETERNPERQKEIQSIWLPLFGGPILEGEALDRVFASIKEDVSKIQARGGKVVFLRPPSTGKLLEMENQRLPRDKYWDRLLAESGAPGIHFQDYEELSEFDCPEWSHLTRSDAVLFTHRLTPILKSLLE